MIDRRGKKHSGETTDHDWEIEQLRKEQIQLARLLCSNTESSLDATQFSIEREQIERSRETLIRKRQSQTAACLPRTASILGEQFQSVFRSFAQHYQPHGSKAILDEAIAFAKHLLKSSRSDGWKSEATRFDLLVCRWKRQPFMLHVHTFSYDVAGLSVDISESPKRKSFWVFAWRFGEMGKIHCV